MKIGVDYPTTEVASLEARAAFRTQASYPEFMQLLAPHAEGRDGALRASRSSGAAVIESPTAKPEPHEEDQGHV